MGLGNLFILLGPYAFIILGLLFFIFAKLGTGTGFFARLHYVDKGTPEIIWKIFAVILWVIAVIWIIIK